MVGVMEVMKPEEAPLMVVTGLLEVAADEDSATGLPSVELLLGLAAVVRGIESEDVGAVESGIDDDTPVLGGIEEVDRLGEALTVIVTVE